jgi:glutamine amidotransferase
MISIVDYGVGNIHSFVSLFKRLDIPVKVARSFPELSGASKLILPGVGAFDHAMQRFNDSGMRSAVEEQVLVRKLPVMGICVGMQMLGTCSDEGSLPGLNWVPGRVKSFSDNHQSAFLPSPHMGWNDVEFTASSQLLARGFESPPRFYFLHSYYFETDDKSHVAAKAEYGFSFEAALYRDNIYGVQFHPEKSHSWGTQLLKNFAEL